MKIKMIKTVKGSPDGFIVRQYYKGCIYDVPDSLAHIFLSHFAAFNFEDEDEGLVPWVGGCLAHLTAAEAIEVLKEERRQ